MMMWLFKAYYNIVVRNLEISILTKVRPSCLRTSVGQNIATDRKPDAETTQEERNQQNESLSENFYRSSVVWDHLIYRQRALYTLWPQRFNILKRYILASGYPLLCSKSP